MNVRNADHKIKFLLVTDTRYFGSISLSPTVRPRLAECSVDRRRQVAVSVVVVPVRVRTRATATCITMTTKPNTDERYDLDYAK